MTERTAALTAGGRNFHSPKEVRRSEKRHEEKCLRIHSGSEKNRGPESRGGQIIRAHRGERAWLGRRVARKIPVLMLLVLAVRPAHAAPSCQQSGVQTWETIEVSHALSMKTELFMEGALRTNCGLSGINPYYQKAEAGFVLQPRKHLRISSYYFLQINEPGVNRKHVLNLEIGPNNFTLHHWIVEDRNRFEEDFQSSGDTTRYSNELRLARPLRAGGLHLEPYAEGRGKYDLKYLGWVYTRVYVGIKKPLTQKISLDGYYVRQFGAHLNPGIVNGIGLTVRARL